MKTFSDFVVEVSIDDKLAKESYKAFAELNDFALVEWFIEKGYSVSDAECKKLKENDDMAATRVGLY